MTIWLSSYGRRLPGAAWVGVDASRFSDAFVHGHIGKRFAQQAVVDGPGTQADAVFSLVLAEGRGAWLGM